MKIGKFEIKKTAALAPMAGVADIAFRRLCKQFNASYLVSEMSSAKAMTLGDKKTAQLLEVREEEHPIALQIFGNDPSVMGEATKLLLQYSPDIIDINMGCPAPKIFQNGSGSALIGNIKLAGDIIRAVVSAADGIPVTVKIRKGVKLSDNNAVEFALEAQRCGAAAITVHGRTREQMYSPSVDLDVIRDVKSALDIPVIGNGDVCSLEDCIKMYDYTGCDLVMIGRGALGNPFIFEQIDRYFETGEIILPPSFETRMSVMQKHVEYICEHRGERIGVQEARKHIAWYIKGIRGAAKLRQQACRVCSLDDVKRFTEQILEEYKKEG